MVMISREAPEKVKLEGFNNLTKCLSFNLYDFVIAQSETQRAEYLRYIDETYSSSKLEEISRGICEIMEAKILEVSKADYDPHGASALVLMSDLKYSQSCPPNGAHAEVHAHINKSHICSHTYPDTKSPLGICSFRIDIDIATCGEISPVTALNFMFGSFESDVVIIDYVVRGFTRDTKGRKIYLDQSFNSIRDFVDRTILDQYQLKEDLIIPTASIWQTKLCRLDLNLENYFMDPNDLRAPDIEESIAQLRKEMKEVYYMHPI